MAREAEGLYTLVARHISDPRFDIIRQDPTTAGEFGRMLAVAVHHNMPDACLTSLVNGFLSVLAVQRKIWVNPKE